MVSENQIEDESVWRWETKENILLAISSHHTLEEKLPEMPFFLKDKLLSESA